MTKAKAAAAAAPKTAPTAPANDQVKAELLAGLRDVEKNAKHDDPRQSVERLAGLIAGVIEQI